MLARYTLCLLAILVAGALLPGDAAAQYGGGPGRGYYGRGGGSHAEDQPRRERHNDGQNSGSQRYGGKQCYTKRSKVGDRWESQTVCE